MYAAAFDYIRASSWSEAVDRLQELGDDAHILAGGQSLVPMMMLRMAAPVALIDVAGADQRTIEVRDGTLALSALVRHVDLEHSALLARQVPMLTQAVRQIGNVRVRQRGTLGGSLAHGEATAELPCVALALGATVHVLGPDGERTIAAADLAVSHLTTSLAPAEVITRIEFPVLGPGQGSCFLELARRAGDFAMVEVAVLLTCDDDQRVTDVRLVVGAVGYRAEDMSHAAGSLLGRRIDETAVHEVGRTVAAEVQVGPSTHASVAYRREMVAVFTGRALRRAADAALHDGAGDGERG